MSELYDTLQEVVQDRAAEFADTVLNQSTGVSFSAEIETNLDPFTLSETLARDPRAKIKLYILSDSEAAALKKDDLVRIAFGGQSRTYRIVDGYHSASGITSQFLAIELVPGKDAL